MCASNSVKRFPRARAVLAGACAAVLPAAHAYDFITDFSGPFPIAWNPGTVPISIRMPASGTLLDGTTYNTTIEAAVREWNTVLGTIQLAPSLLPTADNVNGNGVNEVVMTPTINGAAFGTNVLAVALTRVTGTTRAEGDVLFNPIWIWDSYRGPRAANPERFDMRRVALHELGHVLGLDHPDEDSPPQNVVAIMNSRISNTLDSLQADDIAGAQALYGAPGFVPANNNFSSAAAISGDLPIALEGTNVAASKEGGEPNHAGNSGGRSVWWRWTAPATGSAAVTTTGSLFDTLLAVYTGSSVSGLTQVAANNDAGSGLRTSAVTFSTSAGTTYHIAVDGVSGDAAPILLNLAFASGGSAPPVIRRQPSSIFVSPGGGATLVVDATGATSFQWLFNGVPTAGANGSTLTLTGADAARAGNYQVQVSSAGGTITSTVANLTVLPSALPNQTVTQSRNVSFAVPNSNNAVQWQFSSNGGASWNNVPNDSTYSGATSSQLTLSNASATHHGLQIRYQLTGEGSGGFATSAPATLSVAPLVLPHPVGITPDGSGGFLVADSTDDAIVQVSASGAATVFAGARGTPGATDGAAAAARFNDPTGIVRDPASGSVFIVDSGNHLIRQIAPNGDVTTVAGAVGTTGSQDGSGNAARFNAPTGIARAADGSLYLADTQNHTIRRIVLPGTVTTIAGTAGQSGAQDGAGTAARFNQPRGLAFDAAGNLYVADTGNHVIRKITPAGEVTTIAGRSGLAGTFDSTTGTGALFNEPTGIAVGTDGNLYVTDVNTCFVRRVSPDGAVSTLAGLTRTTSLKDGTGREAWFNQPRAIAASGDAFVVADTGNATLRRLATDGTVTTIALSGTPSTPPPAPTPPPTPTPTPTPSGGGGGGGSPSLLFALAAAALLLARRARARGL
jgi:sugar lactone lactonase YvrE